MCFVPTAFRVAKSAGGCVLALLLLLTPLCSEFCHAQLCRPDQLPSEKSACHESARTFTAGSAKSNVRSVQTCNLRRASGLPASSSGIRAGAPSEFSRNVVGVGEARKLCIQHDCGRSCPIDGFSSCPRCSHQWQYAKSKGWRWFQFVQSRPPYLKSSPATRAKSSEPSVGRLKSAG